MDTLVELDFRLIGKNIDSYVLDKLIGIKCTESYLDARKTLFWSVIVESNINPVNVSALCDKIFNQLIPKKDTLNTVIDTYNLKPSFCLTIYQHTIDELPTGEVGYTNGYINKEIMLFLGSIGANLYLEV